MLAAAGRQPASAIIKASGPPGGAGTARASAHDARGVVRAWARTGGEFSGGRGLARERPVPGAVMGHQRQSAPIRTPTDHPIPISV